MSSPTSNGSLPSGSSFPSENFVFTPRESDSPSSSPSPGSENRSLPGEVNPDISTHMQSHRLSSGPPPIFDLRGLAEALGHSNAPVSAPATPGPSVPRGKRSAPRGSPSAHAVTDEEPPEDKFNAPEFQQALIDSRALIGGLASVLASSAIHVEPDSTIQGLRRKADELAKFECPPTRTVGLVGDSGVGKSSLLNSLLDTRDLARTSNNGAACTCVVTEYRYHNAEHFAINVELFDEDEVSNQIQDMFRDYRHFHLRSEDMETDEERKHWKERADLARDTFQAMFRGRFTVSFLQGGQPDGQILDTLLRWATDLRPHDLDEPLVGRTLSECSASLMALTSETDSSQAALWPYIRKISVSLNAHILSKGLVLVDLPGLRDLNSARRNITERYILECDEIFAVCFIGRAITDAGVASVFELARQAKLSNVGIICTRSDDINPTEACRDWRGARAKEIQRLLDASNDAKEQLRDLQEQLEDLDDGSDSDSSENNTLNVKLHPLYRSLQKTRGIVQRRELELQRYLILTRNALVIKKLSEMYGKESLVKVFCASNTLYWNYRSVCPKEKAVPFLELSGIISVRRHCIAIVSDSQLRIATAYLRDRIPDLLSNLQLWVQSGESGSANAERKQAIRETLNALEQKLRRDLTGRLSPPNVMAKRLVMELQANILDICQFEDWTEGAVEAGQDWSSWYHSTYAAFCRQYGNYSTGAAGHHDWNSEAMATMSGELTVPWHALCVALQSRLNAVLTSISTALDTAYDHLEAKLGDHPTAIVPLEQALMSRQRLLEAVVEDLFERFNANVGTLRTDVLSGLRTSYFGEAMETSYRAANCQSGSGSWGRKKAIINGKLADDDLFRGLMRRLKSDFKELANTLQTDVQASVAESLEVVRGTLDMIRSENVALESEKDPGFRTRVDVELKEVIEAMGRIQGVVSNTNNLTAGTTEKA
ncbi:hypothetical protein B0T16DRAFT_438330 [Cercophora newfieldiana]|uniref:Uncharacterized protein n=1 Tax=Cercophora newfieldiana TaxID=92897 RepID=A0AA40CM79_9PEZI|nr:hypothetical protein B0T16DRAFT_438330 [Cercophora newfieldiana]